MQKLINPLLSSYEREEAKAILRMILEDVHKTPWTRFVAYGEQAVGNVDDLRREIARLASGEPVQHVIGHTAFCGRRFRVTPDTLIPRPETAELVRWIADAEQHRPSPRILDIGTGTGCIAISLAHLLPHSLVTALDVSEKALAVARANDSDEMAIKGNDDEPTHDVMPSKRCCMQASDGKTNHDKASIDGSNNVEANGSAMPNANKVTFLLHDILSPTAPPVPPQDIIVSNPPYIRRSESATMHRNVLDHEPHLALFVPDDDPLLFYRAIARHAQTLLAPHGVLYFELNALHATQTADLVSSLGFTNVELRSDQFSRPRFLRCEKAQKKE